MHNLPKLTDAQMGLLLRLYDRPNALEALSQAPGLQGDLDHLTTLGLTTIGPNRSIALTQGGADHVHALIDPSSGPLLQYIRPSSRA